MLHELGIWDRHLPNTMFHYNSITIPSLFRDYSMTKLGPILMDVKWGEKQVLRKQSDLRPRITTFHGDQLSSNTLATSPHVLEEGFNLAEEEPGPAGCWWKLNSLVAKKWRASSASGCCLEAGFHRFHQQEITLGKDLPIKTFPKVFGYSSSQPTRNGKPYGQKASCGRKLLTSCTGLQQS